jgi:hypothetical protein
MRWNYSKVINNIFVDTSSNTYGYVLISHNHIYELKIGSLGLLNMIANRIIGVDEM